MSISRDNDPFAPPKAAVLTAEAADGNLDLEGRRVPTGRGVEWFGEGWRLFKRAPGTWVLIFVVFMLLWLAMGIIPMGGILANLLYPVFIAGVMLGCRSLEEGGNLEVSNLFDGFKKNTGNLILVGVLYLVGWLVITLVVVGIGMAIFAPALASAGGDMDFNAVLTLAPWFLLVALIALALMLPLIMALWFAPALVVFHDVQPIEAMKASFNGCLRNFLPFLAYGVVGFLLAIVALIPLGLGLLVYGPLLWATMYVGYRDIFIRPA